MAPGKERKATGEPMDLGDILGSSQPLKVDYRSIGTTGLKNVGGLINESTLRGLSGRRAAEIYKEMGDNDPSLGIIEFMIRNIVRGCSWHVREASDAPEDLEAADFVRTCMHDMDMPWDDYIDEHLSMIRYGYSLHEIVYKRRAGRSEENWLRSKYQDGRIGWRGIPLRAQDTIDRWVFDDAGTLTGVVQQDPTGSEIVEIPMSKMLLFRTRCHKNNPEGEALDPQTPIPTPDGWRLMDELQPGDRLFDEKGQIRHVIGRQDWENRPCYEIKFSCGDSIVADANHKWLVQTQKERVGRIGGRVRTTEEMAAEITVMANGNSKGTANHGIPWAGALQYVHQMLPVNPYVLGQWLGDGDKNCPRITTHSDDAEETATYLAESGYNVKITPHLTANSAVLSLSGDSPYASSGPGNAMRAIGVIKNKHIPEAYLRSSIAQRWSLLQGLMDSDGYVNHAGGCEFSNSNIALINGVQELVRSLGYRATVSKKLHSQSKTWQHSVKFTSEQSPFRLKRKTARIKKVAARKNHYIVSIEPVDSRRTVCIEVDSPSHLFLAGKACVPTHNSAFRRAYRPYYFKKNIEETEAIGIQRDLAGMPVVWMPPEVMAEKASPNNKALYQSFKDIVTKVRRDELEGVLMPLMYDENGNKMFEFQLLSSGGSRQFDTSKIIDRLKSEIFDTALAGMIMLGQGNNASGSWAMHSDKTQIFLMSLKAYLSQIKNVYNLHAVPRLLELNGMEVTDYPQIDHTPLENVDMGALAGAISQLSMAGMPIFPNPDIERRLLEVLGLPVPADTDRQTRQRENLPARTASATDNLEETHPDTPVVQAEVTNEPGKRSARPIFAGGPTRPNPSRNDAGPSARQRVG